LNLHTAIFLFFAGALGGAINAVAGGGSFVSFPALLFTGVPAIPANATNTLALWVGTTGERRAYREKLYITRRVMIPLVITSVIGGLAGAFLLIKTPAQTFLRVSALAALWRDAAVRVRKASHGTNLRGHYARSE